MSKRWIDGQMIQVRDPNTEAVLRQLHQEPEPEPEPAQSSVNEALTLEAVPAHLPESESKPKREKSTAEVRGAMRRMMRAYVSRIERDGDVEAFAELVRFRAELDAATDQAAAALLGDGWAYSTEDLAAELGQSRQNVHRRWGKHVTRRPGHHRR